VSRWPRVWLAIAWPLCCGSALAAPNDSQDLNRQFQAAVAQYDAGNYSAAAAQLEKILPQTQNSFEVRELLGMVYASQGSDAKAIEQLQAAVHIKPNSAAARVNLASSLVHSGKNDLAAMQFRKAVELEPENFTANHDLGELYIEAGKLAEAQPLLAHAQKIDPTSYDNGYDLAQADFLTGKLDDARTAIQALLAKKNTGELHNLLAQVDEKDGKFVDAAKEYEAAAQMDPSEDNLFDWASELLLHRTYEPAIEVFKAAAQRYPKSPRLEIGLGMALYARGLYEDAVKALLAAADLAPSDPRCYLFLSKAYESSPTQADEVIEHFRRFAELQPANASAQYYYAMSLWKGKRAEDKNVDLTAVETGLKKAIALNDSLADPHMRLGILYADRHEYDKSIPELERAIQLDSNLPDAHYRLATDYVHAGQKDRAQAEFAIYQKQRAQHMAELDKERAEVQQFVYSAKGEAAAKP
jgi:tetratricopeptide (TPR) repeat protein